MYLVYMQVNWSYYAKNGLIERTGEYICPICLNSFNKEQLNKLSMEDAPQASLGGRKLL